MQLSLAVSLADDECFDNFYAEGNLQAYHYLRQLLDDQGNGNTINYISGEKGSGKSHLLYAICAHASQLQRYASYVDFAQLNQWTTDVLQGLEHCDVVCLDNVDCLQGHRDWQVALFDLINRVLETGQGCVVITGSAGPASLPLELADLKSRLSWGICFMLQRLSDEQAVNMLCRRAQARGLNMPVEVGQFLVSRSKRDTKSLIKALNQLDKQSLQQQRKLTIPFVKQTLAL